jgi:hypothetical protein
MVTGWYVGDVTVYDCPELPGPVLAAGDDYEDPDSDGRFTIVWQRPEGARSPDEIEESAPARRRRRDRRGPLELRDQRAAMISAAARSPASTAPSR